MSLFVCSNPRCKAVENTATSPYWQLSMEKKPVLCSECGWGKWHGRFKKTRWNGIFWKYVRGGRFVEMRWFAWPMIKFSVVVFFRKIKNALW